MTSHGNFRVGAAASAVAAAFVLAGCSGGVGTAVSPKSASSSIDLVGLWDAAEICPGRPDVQLRPIGDGDLEQRYSVRESQIREELRGIQAPAGSETNAAAEVQILKRGVGWVNREAAVNQERADDAASITDLMTQRAEESAGYFDIARQALENAVTAGGPMVTSRIARFDSVCGG